MKLTLHVNGASIRNPGQAGIGVVIYDNDGQVLTTYSATLAYATNNEAEYHAVIEGLKLAQKMGADEVTLLSDSQLVVRQLSGGYRARSPKLQKLHLEALRLAKSFRHFTIQYIHRDQNALADRLARETAARGARE